MKPFIKNDYFGYFTLTYIVNFFTVIIAGVISFFISIWLFVAILLIMGIFTMYTIKKIRKATLKVNKYIDDRVNEISDNQKFFSVPLPYVVIDKYGIVLWYNSLFSSFFEDIILIGKKISVLELNVNPEMANDTSVVLKQRSYRLIVEKIQNSQSIELLSPSIKATQDIYSIFFVDTTEEILLKQQLSIEKTAVALIFVDNYDEVLASIEDFRHALLTAHVDRKLTSFANQQKGILRKFENDKYLFLFSSEKISSLKENKFAILDQIREINIGNHLPITLSIGIGINGSTLSETMEFSRSAVDLALSRGGDQVLIKDNDKYLFFGGKLKTFDNNTRVRARVKAYGLTELLEESSNVFVMGHKNADFDCFGASIGVFRIATALGKPCSIIYNSPPINLNYFYNSIIAMPEYSNLVVNEQQAAIQWNDKTLLIVVDTHRRDFVESSNILSFAKKIVVFDHHRKSTDYINNAVLAYHEPYASSTCELITEMMQYIKDGIKLKQLEADALLAGITVDTKGFSSKTGARTFEAAAYLRRSGADTIRVRNMLKSDMETYKARATIVSEAEIFKDNMAISTCPTGIGNPGLATAQAADELLNISGIEASFVLCHSGDKIVVSARSLGGINVQVIMEKLGGGGHQSTAGTQLSDATIYSAREKVKNAIQQYMNEN